MADQELPLPDPPTVGDAVRILNLQLVFWRRAALALGALLMVALMAVLIGVGALLSVAASSSNASADAERAATSAASSSQGNAEVLAIIQAQTGPEAQARQAQVIQQFLHGVDCTVRLAGADLAGALGAQVPKDYLDTCPTTRTTTTTTEAP